MRYITVEDLSFQYDSEPVLEGINCHLDGGESITLTGENGAAKSTSVKAALGILTPKSGQAATSKTSKEGEELCVAYLPQQIASFNAGFPLTACEFVKSGRYPKSGWFHHLTKHDDEHIKISLEPAGMWKNRHRGISSLSGGQKQHVVIARIFASDPDVFILDEPITGMDAGTTETFYELMHHGAHRHGKSVLMIIHGPDEVKHYTDCSIHLIRSQKTLWRCFNMHSIGVKGAVDAD